MLQHARPDLNIISLLLRAVIESLTFHFLLASMVGTLSLLISSMASSDRKEWLEISSKNSGILLSIMEGECSVTQTLSTVAADDPYALTFI